MVGPEFLRANPPKPEGSFSEVSTGSAGLENGFSGFTAVDPKEDDPNEDDPKLEPPKILGAA